MRTAVLFLTFVLCSGFSFQVLGKPNPMVKEVGPNPDTLPPSYEDLFTELTDTIAKHFYRLDFIENTFPGLTQSYRVRLDQVKSREDFNRLVKAYLAEFQTSHTSYHTPADYTYYHLASIFEVLPLVKKVFKNEEILYPSIGLLTAEKDEAIKINGVLDGSSAHQAGIKKGDVIQHIDNQRYKIDYLHEKLNQKMTIQVLRGRRSLSFEVIPSLVNPQKELEVAARQSIRMIEQGNKKLGYIHIWSFAGRQYYELLKETILFGELKDADGLILDIRDGWGGASPEYLNVFNKNIPLLTMIDRQQNVRTFDSQWRKPVVLLTNNGSRSGKEVLAYGFKKYKIGPVVGEKTAGAVTAGRIFFLSDNSLLYLAVNGASVDGEILEGKGVDPDVSITDDLRTVEDEQLKMAIKVLMEQF